MFHAARLLRAAILLLPAAVVHGQERVVGDDLTQLPPPVAATRAALLDAAKGADPAALQEIIDQQERGPQLGFGGAKTATEFASSNSETGDGLDVLASLADLLEAPYAEIEDGEGGRLFIWPYLAGADLGDLADADKVVAYQLVDPETLSDFVDYGGWLGFRAVISGDGDWTAWVAGD